MSTSRVFGINQSEYSFYSTIACVDVLRGIMVHDDFDAIISKSQVVRDYLSRASSVSSELYRSSLNELQYFYYINRFSEEEECQQLIRNLIDDFAAERGFGKTTYVQRDFARLIAFLAEKYDCNDVFEPFAGKATFAEFLPLDMTYVGQEINPQLCMLANLRLESQYRQNSKVEHADSLSSFRRSDMIVSEMPWGGKIPDRQSYESFFLQEASFSARKISVGIYPYGILFRDSKERQLRQELIDSDLIDCVIKLPARLYAPAAHVQTCIIITNRHKTRKGYVRFIDASSFFVPKKAYTRLDVDRLIQVLDDNNLEDRDTFLVSKEAIINNDANLAIERYRPIDLPEIPEGYELTPLWKLIERITLHKEPEEALVPIIRISDLAVKPLDFVLSSFKVEKRPYIPGLVYVNEPALLISKFQPLKPTSYVEDGRETGRGVYIRDIFAFRIKGEVTTPYLLNELTKEYVQKQLIYSGAAQQIISASEFLNVKILLPSLEEQNLSVMMSFKEDEESGIQDAKRILDAEMRQRAHTIGHPITDIGRICRNLAELMRQQNGVLHEDDIVNRKGETVGEQMEKLLFASERASVMARNLTSSRAFGEPQPILIYEFIADFIKKLNLPKFKPTLKGKKNTYRIQFAPNDLQTVMDNIFSNISKHSFPEDSFSPDNKVEIELREIELYDEPGVSILIKSNGALLDPSLNPEDVFMWGHTSSKDPNHGYGGNQIKTAVEHFGGEVHFLTEQDPNKGYTTAYQILLPLISAQK